MPKFGGARGRASAPWLGGDSTSTSLWEEEGWRGWGGLGLEGRVLQLQEGEGNPQKRSWVANAPAPQRGELIRRSIFNTAGSFRIDPTEIVCYCVLQFWQTLAIAIASQRALAY